jgi:chaperonin GroEL (HSP60 family)
VSEAIYLAGSLSSHVSLEKWEGTGCEVEETESFHASLKIHHEKEAYLKGTMFALFTRPIFEVEQIIDALEYMGSFEGRPLVIIAPMVGGKALQTIKMNNHKGTLEVYACDAPRVIWGKGWLDDFAAFTGATVIDQKYEKFKPEYYGSAINTVLNYNEMIVDPYDDHVDKTADRVDELLREADNCPFPHTQDQLRKRANALNGTLVRLKVGGATEAEARWRRGLVEKSLLSMMDAKVNGYVEGAIPTLYNIETGNEFLDRALKAPFKVVCHNLGLAENDQSIWQREELYQPFPVGRIIEILDKSISIATTIGSVGYVIRSKK